MYRWIARALRLLLFVLGVLLVIVLPVSYFAGLLVRTPWPGAYGQVAVYDGACSFTTRQSNPFMQFHSVETQLYRVPPHPRSLARALWPQFTRSQFPAGTGVVTQTNIHTPLWLLAALCLAWPVTSFILSNRRRRGFPVNTMNAEKPPDGARGTSGDHRQ